MNNWYELNEYQIRYLLEILDNELVVNYKSDNDWYADFIPSIRFDIVKKKCISQNQLYQVMKLANLCNIPWRLCV